MFEMLLSFIIIKLLQFDYSTRINQHTFSNFDFSNRYHLKLNYQVTLESYLQLHQ